ncbi:uncharacterized protein [Hoplias malabaricus]|uniref:uncharacterized protein n=1 Tax=Hoplias malabaricus TaxID=27720 RepID=UPI003462D8F3
MQRTFWTLRFFSTEWHRADKKRVHVRLHYVELTRGALAYHWWIHTKGFFIPSAKCPVWTASTARVTLAQRVDGLLTPVASCAFTEEHSCKTSGGVEEGPSFLDLIFVECLLKNHCTALFPSTECVVVVQVTEVLRTCQSLFIGQEAWSFRTSSGTEVTRPDPDPQLQPEPTPETSGDAEAVAREVPSLHIYSEIKRMTSFPLKLRALRQAFTTTLSEAGCRCSLREAGRMMLEDLAALNDRDVRLFQQLYHRLLVTAESPSCGEGVVEELAEIGVSLNNQT